MSTHGTVLAGYMQREAAREISATSNRFANGIAWVQGELTPLREARIPLIDQGFLQYALKSSPLSCEKEACTNSEAW